jgi:hypothetical protein
MTSSTSTTLIPDWGGTGRQIAATGDGAGDGVGTNVGRAGDIAGATEAEAVDLVGVGDGSRWALQLATTTVVMITIAADSFVTASPPRLR